MSALSKFTTSDQIENETDTLGGGGPLDSDIYEFNIDMAYVIKSKGGATAIVLDLTTGKKELKQTLWVSSGDAKGNKNYYENDAGEKNYLPGFNLAESLCLLTVAKPLSEMVDEEKLVNIYDYDQKKDVPTKVPVLTELLNQKVYGAVFRQTVDKKKNDGNGNYVATGETREENELVKFFRIKDKMTTAEVRAAASEAAFFDSWKEKFANTVRDRSTKNATSGTAGAPQANGSAQPTKSLFS